MVDYAVILNFFKDCDFDVDLTEENFYENIIEYLPKNISFNYYYGATKLVIIFPGADYVVKVPFSGQDMEFFDDYNKEWHYDFIEFAGARGDTYWDYCSAEVEEYKRAESCGLGQFFAKTELIGCVKGYPIYIQERIDILKESNRYYAKVERRESAKRTCREKGYKCFEASWVADLMDYCSEELFNRAMKYFTEQLNDLHSGNIGYLNGAPILADYSGFYS